MVSIGFVLMVMNCTPAGCGYEVLDGEITTRQVCVLDKAMMVLAEPQIDMTCAEVHRDKDKEYGTDRYFRSGITQAEDSGGW